MQYFLLSLSYVIPIMLIVWLWFGLHLGRKSKLILTLLLPAIYFFHWTVLQQSKGWPSDQILPERFELISADVLEPNPLKKIKGNIHLWIRPDGNNTPRSYILPYSRALHKKLFETRQRSEQGRTQIGLLYKEETSGTGASIGNGLKLDFQDAPRRRLPPKL